MNFLKQFFGVHEPPAPVEPVAPVREVCQFTVDTGDCSLIQQLKQKQADKRELDAKIKAFESARLENVTHFVTFLMAMERIGFEMERDYSRSFYNSAIYHYFQHRGGTAKLEDILCDTTDNELNLMFEELRNLRNKAAIISEYRAKSSQLYDEIAELKTKLGIE